MTFNSLKQTVFAALQKQSFTTTDSEIGTIHSILVGALLFTTLEKLLSSDTAYTSKISSLADNYATTYKNIIESLKGKYLSYKTLYSTCKKYNLTSFLKINRTQINEINAIYKNKQEIKTLSLSSYSPYMYGILSLTDTQNTRLRSIHYNVIVPIISHYKTLYNIKFTDINIDNEIDANPGKIIKINISSVSNSKLYSDISNDIFNIKKFIYKVDLTDDNYVKIIMN